MENVIMDCHYICTSMHLPDKSAGSSWTTCLTVLTLEDSFIVFGSTSTSNEDMLM